MATLKLKPKPRTASTEPRPARAPVRGAGSAPRKRPTLSEAQAQRAEREARYQEQLRQRYGDRPPPAFTRRDEPAKPPRPAPRPAPPSAPRSHKPNTAFESRAPARERAHHDEPMHVEIPGSMRLSKRMSELGIASRREADEWIAKGWVRVDDQVVSELGSRVVPGQRITVDAKAKFQQAQKVTVLLNKPVGYVSGQAEDGYEPAVVLVTPQNLWREDRSGTRFLREHLRNLAPAGRLDIDSVGLLVLTQDGRIAKQLIGEDSEMEKEYLVRVQTLSGSALPAASLALLNHGLELDGEALRPAQVEWVNDDQLRFVLKEGKKRQIRRMCEAVGLKVLGLKRVRIGRVMLGDLPPGQWRYLRVDESFA
ncbi:MAG TPA: pseudouridine synthase [Albitalea sp.]|nr:pseudouridine synthase [Albitalea sp.]